ncbi:MAG: hypothetical protein ACTSRZ_03140 [Promethearchaeota archaeon]
MTENPDYPEDKKHNDSEVSLNSPIKNSNQNSSNCNDIIEQETITDEKEVLGSLANVATVTSTAASESKNYSNQIGFYRKLQMRYLNWRDRVTGKTEEEKKEEELYGKDWDELGYHRTIAGYLYTFGLLIPQILFGIMLVPFLQFTELRYVEVGGVASMANGLFGALYAILDLDLNASINRFVPQYAISNPKRSIQYVSFFIKYQMWSGIFQISFVSIYILYYLIPTGSQFAWLSWYLLFIVQKQYPATLGTFKSLIGSLQHKNKENLIVFYRASIIEPLTKLGGGILGIMWGRNNPVVGEMMGLALGTAIGGYVDDFFTFGLGMFWLSKILDKYGIRIRDIYGEKVPKDVWKSALSYSARLWPKTIFGAVIGWSGFIITVENLAGYTTYKSLTDRAGDLAKFVTWSDDIINASQPVFSEAYNNKKINLTKFYIAQGLKYNSWMFMILATFNILAFPAIIDIAIPVFLPEEWRPIVYMVPVYVILFTYKPFNDIADKMVYLSGHPEINTYISIMQTIGNLFFTWFFMVHLEMGWLGLILIGVPMELTGFIIRWIFMSTKILKLDIKFWKDIAWQTFIAPLLSGGVYAFILYFLLYVVYPLIKAPFVDMSLFGIEGGGILIPGLIILVLLMISVLIVYLPLYSFFGGWDDRTLKVFKKSVALTGPSLFLIYPMYKIFLQFHKKAPPYFKRAAYIKLGEIAQEELKELAIMRKNNIDIFKKSVNN